MRRRDARSGFRRKNSRQNPSDSLSYSASSSSLESQPGRSSLGWNNRGGGGAVFLKPIVTMARRASALESGNKKKKIVKKPQKEILEQNKVQTLNSS